MAATACDKLGLNNPSPTAPTTPIPTGSAIVYSAIGASDALGVGSSRECLPIVDCPDGKGYVPVAAGQLRAQGHTVTVATLGIPTGVISRSFQALGQQYGRDIRGNLTDHAMPFVLSNSTLVTIFAGGNDVNTITAALGGGAGGADPAGYIDRQVAAFGADYATLVAGIRARASGARIIVVNLPNLAGMPFLTSVSLLQRQAAQRAAVGMTGVINKLANVAAVVDLMCDSRTYLPTTFSSDGFHPSDAGYAFIAGEIVLAATSASYAAPRAACAQMTIVPNP